MIFARINLCEIENPARLHYFRVYGARGRGEPENVCELGIDRAYYCEIEHLRGFKRFDGAIRFYARRRKNYAFTSEGRSLSERFAATRLRRSSASIKTDGCMPFEREPARLQFVVTQHGKCGESALCARPCTHCTCTRIPGVHKALSSLSRAGCITVSASAMQPKRPSIPLLPY